MSFWRVIIQECKPGTVEMLTNEAEKTFVPRVKQIPGFISYQVGKVDDRTLFAIGQFETREAAEALERLGAEWRRLYGKDAIVSARPYLAEIILDERALRTGARATEAQPSP